MTLPVRILGIDPGLRRTGWGVVTATGTKLAYVDCGVVTSDGDLPLALRLRELYEGITRIVESFRPDEVSVEETFVNKDAQATLKLGHARAMALLVPALAGTPVFEYSANLIKKTVSGSGHAEKAQIQAMVKFLLPLAQFKVADAADALAIAITHNSHRGGHALKRQHAPVAGASSLAAARIAAALARN
ncbi:Holliday junction resolvase [Methylobacterium sp. Leaf113]|uniref:crossover junction endodeoxyribonuclease RuvC n=1 Tax=unclassified Methylobacterium TaxID=2615210 RepID=UPI0006F20CC6|nr:MULTISPECIES: crossover junction endodeoxyribonuclease RuvC [unclassified Methylobacterium]KQP88158.1 Holliday junction resolvase [Methylobacterium sp. Leaf117]KQP94776.1 Holliday junction resolvase [Methylobacterium sp. Leaf113]